MITLKLLTKKQAAEFIRVKEYEFGLYYEKYTEKYFMPEYGGYLYTLSSIRKAFIYVRMYKHLEYKMPGVKMFGLKTSNHLRHLYLGNESKIVEIDLNNAKSNYKFLSQKLFTIYALIKNDKVVYIGKTSNIYHRILNHKASGKDFDKLHILIYKSFLDYDRSESILIKKFSPIYNLYLKSKK